MPSFSQHFARRDAFPGRGDLDQHPLPVDPLRFVKLDQLAAFIDRTLDVEREPRVRLSRDPTRNNLQNLAAELDQEVIHDVLDLRRAGEAGAFPIGQHLIEQMKILLFLRGGVNQARVGRGIARLEFANTLEVAGIGDHDGKFLQLLKLAGLRSGFFLSGDVGAHK